MANEKILVVDDEEHIRQALRAALESEDFVVEEAENGKVAVDKTRSWRPRLVLMDVRMPVMDGHMASIEIKYDESLKNTKLIFLTANADDDSRNYGLGHGAEMYLTKPFKVDDLLDRVKSVLRDSTDSAPKKTGPSLSPPSPAPQIDAAARHAYLDKLKKKFNSLSSGLHFIMTG
jgi:two-component system alkaline phosphatase synthesis response regulator PhoP